MRSIGDRGSIMHRVETEILGEASPEGLIGRGAPGLLARVRLQNLPAALGRKLCVRASSNNSAIMLLRLTAASR
jgi:hypothetical protein